MVSSTLAGIGKLAFDTVASLRCDRGATSTADRELESLLHVR